MRYIVGPPPSRGRDLELDGGVNACHVEYVYESQHSHVQSPPIALEGSRVNRA